MTNHIIATKYLGPFYVIVTFYGLIFFAVLLLLRG